VHSRSTAITAFSVATPPLPDPETDPVALKEGGILVACKSIAVNCRPRSVVVDVGAIASAGVIEDEHKKPEIK
jgi:hypothetical protein